jgi:hypothetical protein
MEGSPGNLSWRARGNSQTFPKTNLVFPALSSKTFFLVKNWRMGNPHPLLF